MAEAAGIAVGAFVLALVHVAPRMLRFSGSIPRARWLSFGGGVSVAYVFLHLLPEVARGADVVAAEVDAAVLGDLAVWLAALAGVVGFYVLEVAAQRSRRGRGGDAGTGATVFWASIASYATYNALIAYLLEDRAEAGLLSLGLFVVAIGLHFTVNDLGLEERHGARYKAVGRWVLVGAVVLGAAASILAELPPVAVAGVIGVVAGGVVLNALKDELPAEAQSRRVPFVAGVAVTAMLFLAVEAA